MTVEQLQRFTGATVDGRAEYHDVIDGQHVAGWTGPVAGRRGWWWAVTRLCGEHEIVVALGWTAGSTDDLRRDVERKIRALKAARLVQSQEMAS